MDATSRAGRPATGGATAVGRGQPSGGGTNRFTGAVGAKSADGTGTVVHGMQEPRSGMGRPGTAGLRRRRSVVRDRFTVNERRDEPNDDRADERSAGRSLGPRPVRATGRTKVLPR